MRVQFPIFRIHILSIDIRILISRKRSIIFDFDETVIHFFSFVDNRLGGARILKFLDDVPLFLTLYFDLSFFIESNKERNKLQKLNLTLHRLFLNLMAQGYS